MKCENDEFGIFINDSVKLVETLEHKTYIADTRLHDAEIIDLGVVMTDEESSDDFEAESQKATLPVIDLTSPCRRKERSPSVEIIDLDTCKPEDKTETIVDNETNIESESNICKINDNDDEIEVFDVLMRSQANASKRKRLSYDEEKTQAIQQRKDNKPFDIKKNQGFVGMKVIRPSAIIKQRSNKSNMSKKSITREREKKNVRDPKEKIHQNLKVAKVILGEIKKQDIKIQNKEKEDNNDKIKNYSITKLLEVKNNLMHDLKQLDFKLDVNKKILKPTKSGKPICANETCIDTTVSKGDQNISQKKTLVRNSAFENQGLPKTNSRNNQNVTDYLEKNYSLKPNKILNKEESKIEKRNTDAQTTKQESPKLKKIISIEEYKKAKENIGTTKGYINDVQRKEENDEINKPTTSKHSSLKVTSEAKDKSVSQKNIHNRINTEEHGKEKGNIETTIKFTAQRTEKSKETKKSTNMKNNSKRVASELQMKSIDNRVNIVEHQKETGNIGTTKRDNVQLKEESKEINKFTSTQNSSLRVISELQNKEKGKIDNTHEDTKQSKEENLEVNKSSSGYNISMSVTSEIHKNKNDSGINTEKNKYKKESTDTTKTDNINKEKKSITSQNDPIRVTSEPQKKDLKDRLKLIKSYHPKLTKINHKNKFTHICPIRNRYTETIKERVRKLQQTSDNKFDTEEKKNLVDKPVKSRAVSLAHDAHSQNDVKVNSTAKPVDPETNEAPKVSINVNYTSDSKITIQIINTSPKVPKPLVSVQQVQKQQVAEVVPTEIITPEPQVLEDLAAKPVVPKPPSSDSRVPDPPVSMPLLSDVMELDPLVHKLAAPDPFVSNLPVFKSIAPIPSNPSDPLCDFKKPKPQMPNHLHESNSQFLDTKILKILPDMISKTPKPYPQKSKQRVADLKTTKPPSIDLLELKQLVSKPKVPMSQIYNSERLQPQVLKPRSSYPPVSKTLSSIPPIGPSQSVSNAQASKSMVPDPPVKLAPKSTSTLQPVETREMIEKAVLEYKLGEYYAQQQEMQMNASDTMYFNIPPMDYARKSVKSASIPQHPPRTGFKNKKAKKTLKIWSIKDVGELYVSNKSDITHKEQFASEALQNISKLSQNVPAIPQQFPIQRLVTDRNSKGTKTAMPSNYNNPVTAPAKIYTQQNTNTPGTINPGLQFETYGAYVPYHNMYCIPTDPRLNFPTQQNVTIYQQPSSYLLYNDQYYPSEMQSYLQPIGYNVQHQSTYSTCMGVPMYETGRPPPPPYPTELHIPKTFISKENDSIIGHNNDGVIKKINIATPYMDVLCKNIQSYEPLKQEAKEDKTNIEKYTDKAKEDSITITPVSTKWEMQKVLDNSTLHNSVNIDKSDLSVVVSRNYLKRPHERSPSYEDKKRSMPCPLSKKMELNGPKRSPDQRNEDPINKKTGYSPPILPIPPNYENCFSMSKHVDFKCVSDEMKSSTACSDGLANLLQLSNKDLGTILKRSGYKAKKIK